MKVRSGLTTEVAMFFPSGLASRWTLQHKILNLQPRCGGLLTSLFNERLHVNCELRFYLRRYDALGAEMERF